MMIKETLDELNESFDPEEERHYNCLVNDTADNVIKEVTEWCEDNKVSLLIIDAKDINVISVDKMTMENNEDLVRFKIRYSGNGLTIEDFAKKCTLHTAPSHYEDLDKKALLLKATEDNKECPLSEFYVNRDDISNATFLDEDYGMGEYYISTQLEQFLKKNKCIILFTHLFTIDESMCEYICRRFIRVENNEHIDRSNLLTIVANCDKEKGEEEPYYVWTHNVFFSHLN